MNRSGSALSNRPKAMSAGVKKAMQRDSETSSVNNFVHEPRGNEELFEKLQKENQTLKQKLEEAREQLKNPEKFGLSTKPLVIDDEDAHQSTRRREEQEEVEATIKAEIEAEKEEEKQEQLDAEKDKEAEKEIERVSKEREAARLSNEKALKEVSKIKGLRDEDKKALNDLMKRAEQAEKQLKEEKLKLREAQQKASKLMKSNSKMNLNYKSVPGNNSKPNQNQNQGDLQKQMNVMEGKKNAKIKELESKIAASMDENDKKLQKLREDLANAKAEVENTQTENRKAQQKIQGLTVERDDLLARLAKVEEVASQAMELATKNKTLETDLKKARDNVTVLDAKYREEVNLQLTL